MSHDFFRRAAEDSRAWLERGEALLLSADVLWERVQPLACALRIEMDAVAAPPEIPLAPMPADVRALWAHVPAFYLLAGYGIENLLKAVHVKRRIAAGHGVVNIVNAVKAKLFGVPTNHDYVDLARKLSLAVDPAEAALLRWLSRLGALGWTIPRRPRTRRKGTLFQRRMEI